MEKIIKLTPKTQSKTLKGFCEKAFGITPKPRNPLVVITPDWTLINLVRQNAPDGWKNNIFDKYLTWYHADSAKVDSEIKRYESERDHKYLFLIKETPTSPCKFLGAYKYNSHENGLRKEVGWKRISDTVSLIRDADGNVVDIDCNIRA